MDERTITITQSEYKELHEIAVRYKVLIAMHSNDTYISKEDRVLYDFAIGTERGVENVDE